VGKVEVVLLEGLDFWFNSSDHLPPHLHARRRGEWEVRIYFLLCTDDELVFDCKWAKKGPSAKVLARIRKAVVGHRPNYLGNGSTRYAGKCERNELSLAGIDSAGI
jgi:hypothetical protein